jgi:hypothetical protein
MFPTPAVTHRLDRLTRLCGLYLREPSMVTWTDAESFVLVFDPPLTGEEQLILADLTTASEAALVDISPAEWATFRPQLVIIRDFRQLGRNAFMALTAAERDRMLYDAQAATTTILLALLRE